MPTTDINAAFSAGISQHLEIELNEIPQMYSRVFSVDTSDAKFMDVQLWEGYGAPQLKNPGMQGKMGQNRESYLSRIQFQTYYLGDIIPVEDWDDDKYGVLHRLIPTKGGALATAFRTLKEVVHANYLINYAFTSQQGLTASTPDGLSLCNAAHPVSAYNSTTTFSNVPSVPADLSIATAQFMSVNLATQVAANNYTILNNKLKKVVIHPSQRYVAMQVFEGAWERGTADRNENFLAKEGVEIVSWPYFKSSGNIGTNNSYLGIGEDHYLYSVDRTAYRVRTDHDLLTDSIMFAATIRFGLRAVDFRGLTGSPGR